jgi:hypothetical protein
VIRLPLVYTGDEKASEIGCIEMLRRWTFFIPLLGSKGGARALKESCMASPVVQNFMKQQGFPEEPADACNMHFTGLYFQPRIVFPAVLLAIVLQSPVLFAVISAVLWWNVALPRLNPFEAAYNRIIAGPASLRAGDRRALHARRGGVPRAGMDDRSLGLRGVPGRRLRGAAVRQVLPGRLRLPPAPR